MDDPRTLVASSRATDVTPLAAAELSGVTSPQPITLGVRTSTSNGTNNNNCKKNNKKNKDTSVEDSTPVYNLYDVLSYSIPDVAGPVSDGATTAPCVDMGAQHPLVGALNGPALVRVSGSASRSAASAALPCSAGVHEGIRSAAACVGTSGKAAAAREVASGSTASVSASGADTVAEARGVAPSSGAIVVSLGAAESGYSSLQVGLPFSSCSPTRDPLRDGFSWHWGVATLSDASAAPSSTLLLPARINGVAVSGLLDSGATHSLVSHVVAQRLNLPVRGADLHRSMVLANGGLLDVVGFAACSIEIGSARLNCEIIVVPSLSYELIFGMDVLRRLKAVASFASGKLSSSLLSSSLNLIPCFPSAVPSGASASADASSNDPLLDSLVADPSPADPADSLLPDAIDYKDLQDAWDPSAWPTAAAKALDGCLWPDSHRKLLEEFKDVFAAKAGAPGLARVEPFRILTTTPVPVARRGAPHSHHDRAIINKSVDEMLAAGIIRPSTSSYCSPVVLVSKPDGSSRFCVDYRGLNAVTVPDKFPMPLARDIFDALGGFAAFNIMDLASGFFQIPIHPDDAHLTAFQCDMGLFEFVCLPFGVMNGPAVFCRVIISLFMGMGKDEVASFVDDLISPAKDEQDSLLKLRRIFTRLRSAGLKLRLDKCTGVVAGQLKQRLGDLGKHRDERAVVAGQPQELAYLQHRRRRRQLGHSVNLGFVDGKALRRHAVAQERSRPAANSSCGRTSVLTRSSGCDMSCPRPARSRSQTLRVRLCWRLMRRGRLSARSCHKTLECPARRSSGPSASRAGCSSLPGSGTRRSSWRASLWCGACGTSTRTCTGANSSSRPTTAPWPSSARRRLPCLREWSGGQWRCSATTSRCATDRPRTTRTSTPFRAYRLWPL